MGHHILYFLRFWIGRVDDIQKNILYLQRFWIGLGFSHFIFSKNVSINKVLAKKEKPIETSSIIKYCRLLSKLLLYIINSDDISKAHANGLLTQFMTIIYKFWIVFVGSIHDIFSKILVRAWVHTVYIF